MQTEPRIPKYPKGLLDFDRQAKVPNLFGLESDHRTAILVDGPNISQGGRISGQRINYNHLRLMFERHSDLRISNYYTPLYRDQENNSVTMRRFLEYLGYSRWTVITRDGYWANANQRSVNIDQVLAHQCHQLAAAGKIDTVLLVTNDGDFVPMIEICRQAYGTKFLHLSWSVSDGDSYSKPSHILRMECEVSLDIAMDEMSKWLVRNSPDEDTYKSSNCAEPLADQIEQDEEILDDKNNQAEYIDQDA